MSQFIFKNEISQQEFDTFASNHALCNLLQSYNWSKIKSNWGSMHTGVYKDGQLTGVALVLIKQLPLGFTMFYIPRGPIMDYDDQELVTFFFQQLRKEGKRHHCLFIKMDPCIEVGVYPSSDTDRPRNGNEKYVSKIEQAGAIHQGFTMTLNQSIQARFASILNKPEDLFAAMPKKTKKLIKEADKRHIEIVSGQEELLDDFARLVEMTESRKHVSLRNREYFAHLITAYPNDSIIMLAKCNLKLIMDECNQRLSTLEEQLAQLPENQKKKRFTLEEQKASVLKDIHNVQEVIDAVGSDESRPIAGVLTIRYGRTCEMLYAGMDERFRRFMPQYKTYLENFQWAFDHGVEEFSMGGVEGTLDDGLTHFKDNFAPMIHEYIGEFDIPVYKLLYKPAKMMYEKKRQQLKEA